MIAFAGKIGPALAICAAAALLGACATGGGEKASIHTKGGLKKNFTAHSIIFNRNAPPSVMEKTFRCQLESLNRTDLRSYRFSNHVSGTDTPDVVVTLAISGRSAGLGIYSASGAPLAEYPSGKAMENMAEFEVRGKDGFTRVKWYLGEEKIMSLFESYDLSGLLIVSENTVYLAR